ncbi:MAG TPA: hypothetical protein ACFYEE_02880 [Candidatus Wujingus californicus]
MFNRMKNIKLVCFLAFLMFSSLIAGCGISDKKYYKFQPTFNDRAVARTMAEGKEVGKEYKVNGMNVIVEGKDESIRFTEFDVSMPLKDIKVSDADVLGFSSDIQKALRHRMDWGRRLRLTSGTLQVLAASAGAALGLTTQDVTTVSALAIFSAVIPELQNIFQARERVAAYTDGLELIQDADARYYHRRAECGKPVEVVSTTELTRDGSQLLIEIAACIKLVDKALLQTIPTIEDLQVATGRIEEGLGQIKLVPKRMNIDVQGMQTVYVINSKAITYSIDNIGVVKIENIGEFDTGTDKIKIVGVGTGTSKVTVFNALGRSGYFDVTVGRATPTPVSTASPKVTPTATAIPISTASPIVTLSTTSTP